MLIPALVSLPSLIAAATTGPEQAVTLACTGFQTTWRAENPVKLSLPWSRTYTVYLKAKRYCESRCRADTYLDEGDGTALGLGDYGYGPGSTRLTYKAADNSLYGHQMVDFGQRVSVGPRSGLHLETTGTCVLSLGAAMQIPVAAGPTPASVSTPGIPAG